MRGGLYGVTEIAGWERGETTDDKREREGEMRTTSTVKTRSSSLPFPGFSRLSFLFKGGDAFKPVT